jgi:hypothetical protein
MVAETRVLQFAIEPYRIGFVVEESSPDQIKQAAGLAARYWGGVRSPIIPVSADGSVAAGWLQIAKELRPRRLIDLTCTGSQPSAWTAVAGTEWEALLTPFYERLHPVGQVHQLVLHPDPWAAKLTLRNPTGDSIAELFGLGRLSDDEVSEWTDLGVTIFPGVDPVDAALAQIHNQTLVGSTSFQDFDYAGSGMMHNTALIWVLAEKDDVDGALAFWNVRALRPVMFSKVVNLLLTLEDLINPNLIGPLRDAILQSASSVPQCNIVSQKYDRKTLEGIALELGFAIQQGGQWKDRIVSRVVPEPDSIVECAINVDMREFWSGPRESGVPSSVLSTFASPTSQIRVLSPVDFNMRLVGGGAVVLRLRDPMFALPPVPNIGSLFYPNAQTEASSLCIITNPRPAYDLNLKVPSRELVLAELLRSSGVEFELSDKGRQIWGIYSRVEAGKEIFRHPLFVPIVKALTPRSSGETLQLLDRLADQGACRAELDQVLAAVAAGKEAARTLQQIKSDLRLAKADVNEIGIVLDLMVRLGLTQRGFRMVCPLCGIPTFFATRDSADTPQCAGCGTEGGYDVGGFAEPMLCYVLSSLLVRLSVNGGLAPLAALQVLRGEGAHVVPGANLTASATGERLGEVDLVGYNGLELFAGEAKTAAAFFTPEQIKRDVAHSVQINGVCCTDR